MIWGNDGWCYIPELTIRRKFTETGNIQEAWSGVIALPEHIETLTSEDYEEVYGQKESNLKQHKSTRRQRAPRQ